MLFWNSRLVLGEQLTSHDAELHGDVETDSMRLRRNVWFYFPVLRERLKGNADDDGDDEIAEQPMEKIKLEEVENDANDQVVEQS